jgi:hypothetical protein
VEGFLTRRLLDWLALEFIEEQLELESDSSSHRALIRLPAKFNTSYTHDVLELDPDNRFLGKIFASSIGS